MRNSGRLGRGFSLIALALLLVAPSPLFAQTSATPSADRGRKQVPQPAARGSRWSGAGYDALAVLENVGYVPAKVGYAFLGGIIGAGTWLVTGGDTKAAKSAWRMSFGGDYVLTPSMIAGEQPVNFSGPETAPEAAQASASATPEAPAPTPVASPGPVTTPSKKAKRRAWWHIW